MDREAESIALEKKHVRDVYERIAPHFSDTRYRAWPRVKEFLLELEPGSIVADVGCGNGKYLGINKQTFKVGSDCCVNLVDISAQRGHEAMVCDNLRLPYRSNCFDAVVSIAVVHHFATAERRVQAIRELARICRPGGLVMIYVWALEQKQRQFDAQDVLVPWHLQPKHHTRTRRTIAKQKIVHRQHSSSSASDEEEKMKEKPALTNGATTKPSSKAARVTVNLPLSVTQKCGVRSKRNMTLQRHATERDWLREKFPHRQEVKGWGPVGGSGHSPLPPSPHVLRKSYSCEESVVLSGRPRAAKPRCKSDSGAVVGRSSRRLMLSRSTSVEEGEKSGTLWDGFLQVFPALFSPTFSGRSEDDMTPADVGSVFGDDDDDDADDDDDDDDAAKNQWCIINKDGSVANYRNGQKASNGHVLKSRKSHSHLLLNGSGSCDSILPRSSRSNGQVPERASLLLSSQSLDEQEFGWASSPPASCDKIGAARRNLSSFSHNSESAINVKNLKGTNLRVSTSSDTSGFVSSGSINGECSEATKKLLNWRKQQLKLNLQTVEPKDKGFKPLNGLITKSLELLYKTEGTNPAHKKPVVGLNFQTVKGEIFKPFKQGRSRLSYSGSEREHESSFDSVSSSDESLTTFPVKPPKKAPPAKYKHDLPIRSNSLSMLEKLIFRDTKRVDSPLTLPDKPSTSTHSLGEFEPHGQGCSMGKGLEGTRRNFLQRRPASNPNLRSISHDRKATPDPDPDPDTDPSPPQSFPGDPLGDPHNPADPSLFLRYYHVFREGELIDLIEKNIENLHIVRSYYDHANWCVVAEKVEVWRI